MMGDETPRLPPHLERASCTVPPSTLVISQHVLRVAAPSQIVSTSMFGNEVWSFRASNTPLTLFLSGTYSDVAYDS